MPGKNQSWYADEDVANMLDDVDNKSQVVDEAIRQYMQGHAVGRDARIAELESELDEIDEEVEELESRREEVEAELESLRAAEEAEESEVRTEDGMMGAVTDLFDDVVTILPDDRERILKKQASTVPEDVIDAVLDEVDIHHIDDCKISGRKASEVVTEADYDEDVLGGAFDSTVVEEDAADDLQTMTTTEREAVINAAENAL